jgi:IS30 family transposase
VGLRCGDSFTAIAERIGVSISTVSREVGGVSNRARYQPEAAHRRARRRARRPKLRKLELNHQLRERVIMDLNTWWSPQQIAARIRHDFPTQPEMWVSHESIYKALFVQGKGALRREVAASLRSGDESPGGPETAREAVHLSPTSCPSVNGRRRQPTELCRVIGRVTSSLAEALDMQLALWSSATLAL